MTKIPPTPVGFDISKFARIEHLDFGDSGLYRAIDTKTGEEIGKVYYLLPLSDPELIITETVVTHPKWEGRHVASALIERMVLDFPNRYVDLGIELDKHPQPEFVNALRRSMPYFSSTVIQDGARKRK